MRANRKRPYFRRGVRATIKLLILLDSSNGIGGSGSCLRSERRGFAQAGQFTVFRQSYMGRVSPPVRGARIETILYLYLLLSLYVAPRAGGAD